MKSTFLYFSLLCFRFTQQNIICLHHLEENGKKQYMLHRRFEFKQWPLKPLYSQAANFLALKTGTTYWNELFGLPNAWEKAGWELSGTAGDQLLCWTSHTWKRMLITACAGVWRVLPPYVYTLLTRWSLEKTPASKRKSPKAIPYEVSVSQLF